jgi:hypothetical protein
MTFHKNLNENKLEDTFVPSFPINPADITNPLLYGNLFLSGLNIEIFMRNFTNCYNRTLHFIYFEIPLLEYRYYYGNAEDNFFNTTTLIANASNHLMVCNDAARNLYKYGVS